MAKSVTIKSGTIFKTLQKAQDHFSEIRKQTPIGERLGEPHRSDVIDIYERYCRATNWQAVAAADVIATWDNKERREGQHAQTKALAIVTPAGESHVFSIDAALKSIAV